MKAALRLASAALLGLAVVVGLSACDSTPGRADVDWPYYPVPVGSTLVLNQAVTVPAGVARVWMQHGQLVAGYDHYVPNCNFEVRDVLPEQAQVIQPDSFAVVKTQLLIEEVAGGGFPLLIASSEPSLLAYYDNGPSAVYEGYHLWLQSAGQPFVRRLSCRGVFEEPPAARPPSISEIRTALGEIATLNLR